MADTRRLERRERNLIAGSSPVLATYDLRFTQESRKKNMTGDIPAADPSERYREKYSGIGKRPVIFPNDRSPISRNERDRRRAKRKLANKARKRNRR